MTPAAKLVILTLRRARQSGQHNHSDDALLGMRLGDILDQLDGSSATESLEGEEDPSTLAAAVPRT